MTRRRSTSPRRKLQLRLLTVVEKVFESVSAVVAARGAEVFATPAVRRLAREQGVNLTDVVGSGKNGRILKEDVMAYGSGGVQPTTTAASPPGPSAEKLRPLSAVQRGMFKGMATRALKIPHFGYADEIVMDECTRFREMLQRSTDLTRDVKVSYMPIMIKAMSLAHSSSTRL